MKLASGISIATLLALGAWVAGPGCVRLDRPSRDGGDEPGGTGGAEAGTDGSGGAASGLRADYYENPDFTCWKLTRVDPAVDFAWDTALPSPAGTDTFSVRWKGQVTPPETDTYTFHVDGNDGARLSVGGMLLVDDWKAQAPVERSGSLTLTAGVAYALQLEYFDGSSTTSRVALAWSSSKGEKQIVPTMVLSATPGQPVADPASCIPPLGSGGTLGSGGKPGSGGTLGSGGKTGSGGTLGSGGSGSGGFTAGTGLRGDYYDNTDFTCLRMSRTDATVDFNWARGTPAGTISYDNNTVRWSGEIVPRYSETYTFYVSSDDGLRLWVNGTQLIDDWTGRGVKELSGTIALTAGQRYPIKLEYIEYAAFSEAHLSWSSASQPKEIIPASRLYPTSGQPPADTTSCPLPYISQIVVVGTTDHTTVMTLTDGATIHLGTIAGKTISLRADPDPPLVGSIAFTVNGAAFRNEGTPPYCLNGDDGTNCYTWSSGQGSMSLTATPWTGTNGTGTAGTTTTINFTVVDP